MAVPLQEVALAVKRLQWRHHREAGKRLASFGVSLPQWDVLRHLALRPDASLHDLAQLTFQTDQSMGTLASRMVDRRLLTRVEGPGRAVRHAITAEGERVRAAGAKIMDGVIEESIGTLDERDRDTLHRLLVRAAEATPQGS